VTRIGKERGWPPVTRAHFDAVRGKHGALLVGNPKEVAEKILRHSEALGGISRITFQMDVAESSQAKLLRAIELLGTKVAPLAGFLKQVRRRCMIYTKCEALLAPIDSVSE